MTGNWVLNAEGQAMYGLLFPLFFQAEHSGNLRRAWLGLYLPQDGDTPVFSVLFTGPDGVNLITNGDAETGDLTGCTDTDGAWEASTTSPYEGTYSFKHLGSAEVFPGLLELDNISGLTAGEIYSFGFASRIEFGILSVKALLQWRTSGGALISTDTVYGSHSAWSYSQQTFIVPATATNLDIVIDPGDPLNDCYVDNLQLFEQSISTELRWSDGALTAIVDGVTYDLIGARVKKAVIWADELTKPVNSSLTVDTAQVYNMRLQIAGADANDGDEYTGTFHIDAGTYNIVTLGVTTSANGKVDTYIDDVLVNTGQDWYSASTTQNVIKTTSSIVLTGGNHTIKIKLNGKHASSSDYRYLPTKITIGL
jgi:hypothetical protein